LRLSASRSVKLAIPLHCKPQQLTVKTTDIKPKPLGIADPRDMSFNKGKRKAGEHKYTYELIQARFVPKTHAIIQKFEQKKAA
jgi:hypothetical protein